MNRETYGLYLHIPFCRRRCAYCDFFSTDGRGRRIPAYIRALVREIEAIGSAAGRPEAATVYFGGGTPSLLRPEQAGRILDAIRASFRLAADAEITIEANPGTLDVRRSGGFLTAGFNRLSLGVQSLDDGELRMLERIHTADEAERTFAAARRAGWANISLDLIFGLPGQRAETWERTLDRALALAPEHFSLYALTLERGTRLARAVRRGALPAPDDDEAAGMYERAGIKLAARGYRHYEISNWAGDSAAGAGARPARFPRFACRHNLRYWLNRPYLGFGAGAHGWAAGRRYANVCHLEKYLERMRAGRARRFPLGPAASRGSMVAREEEMRETMWLGLRLTEAGVDRESYRQRFDADYYRVFREEIDSALRDGLLEWGDGGGLVRLTGTGRLLGNRVFRLFV
jgi:oxygen-independent coproporphyrinogen-3 oxidase